MIVGYEDANRHEDTPSEVKPSRASAPSAPGLGQRAQTMDPAVLESMTRIVLERVGPAGFITVFRQFIASAHLQLGRIDAPTLLLAAGRDPSLTPRDALAFADAIPRSRLVICEGYDHFCHVRQPRGVAAHIADFAAELSSA